VPYQILDAMLRYGTFIFELKVLHMGYMEDLFYVDISGEA
jgi:hypothetical protein